MNLINSIKNIHTKRKNNLSLIERKITERTNSITRNTINTKDTKTGTNRTIAQQYMRLSRVHMVDLLDNGSIDINSRRKTEPLDISNAWSATTNGCQSTQENTTNRIVKFAREITILTTYGEAISMIKKRSGLSSFGSIFMSFAKLARKEFAHLIEQNIRKIKIRLDGYLVIEQRRWCLLWMDFGSFHKPALIFIYSLCLWGDCRNITLIFGWTVVRLATMINFLIYKAINHKKTWLP